jgi:hypothetical protein
MRLKLVMGLLFVSACSGGDGHQTPSEANTRARMQRRCAEHMPRTSPGPRPAGTADDPFVGDGVVFAVHDVSAELVRVGIRHRAIPHFKIAAEMAVNVPRAVAAAVSPGDFVQVKYARLPDDSPLKTLYASGAWPDTPVQYVYCGYEIVAIDVVPDPEAGAR